MAYALILFGLLLTVSGARGTHNDLFTLLKNDFSGENSFIYWLAAIAVIGGIGYIPAAKGLSNSFLALVLIVLLLSNKGVFDQFTSALKSASAAPGIDEQSALLNPTLFGDYAKFPSFLKAMAGPENDKSNFMQSWA